MNTHKPHDRHWFLLNGSVMTEGASLDLAKGQLGLFEENRRSERGMLVADLLGKPKNTLLVFRYGSGLSGDMTPSGHNFKNQSSMPFRISDVKCITANYPSRTEQEFDDVIFGWDGIDDSTIVKLRKGYRIPITIELSGKPMGILGYAQEKVVIEDFLDPSDCPQISTSIDDGFGCEDCDPCEDVNCTEVFMAAIKRIRSKQLLGQRLLSDFVDVTPITDCRANPTTTPYSWFTLTLCDTGDSAALATVQSQYGGNKVVLLKRKGAMSTYSIMVPGDNTAVPEAYIPSGGHYMKTCADCPTGSTTYEGGYLYSVTLIDDGADQSAAVQALSTNAVAGSAKKVGIQVEDRGTYVVILSEKLTDAEMATFMETNDSAIVYPMGEVADVCFLPAGDPIQWIFDHSCKATMVDYQIILPDNKCGQTIEDELKTYYPASYNVRLSTGGGSVGGCQHKYLATVPTNVVCDECDPIFNDAYVSNAPENYGEVSWTVVPTEVPASPCKCGIRFRGKPVKINPSDCLLDKLAYTETSTRIRVSGGFSETNDIRFKNYNHVISVKYLSKAAERPSVGGNLRQKEIESYAYFTGNPVHHNFLARTLMGEDSNIKMDTQYIDYEVVINKSEYSNAQTQRWEYTIAYHIMVDVEADRTNVEAMLQELATAAGLPAIETIGATAV